MLMMLHRQQKKKAVAALSRKGVKTRETADPQFHINDVADSVSFEGK
jgi:hypothetical protein